MIQITRLLTFKQYAASTRLANLHGPLRRKLNYIAFIYFLPLLALVGVPITMAMERAAWHRHGDQGGPVFIWGSLFGVSIYYLCSPLLFRKKMRRLYKQQELDCPWTLELSDQGVRSTIPGKADTHFEWAFFDCFIETKDLFCLLQKKRTVFITIANDSLGPAEYDELKRLLATNLPCAA